MLPCKFEIVEMIAMKSVGLGDGLKNCSDAQDRNYSASYFNSHFGGSNLMANSKTFLSLQLLT